MLVAAWTHLPNGFANQKKGFEFPLTLAIVSLSLFFTGAGKFSVMNLIKSKKGQEAAPEAAEQTA